MNALRVISVKPPIASVKTIEHVTFCTKVHGSTKLEPVSMSFASYESTQSFEGDGPPPLIVMHGVLGSKANWNSLCKAFHRKTIPQRKIIAVDARNHGDSPHSESHSYPHLAEDVKNLLGQLKIKKAALLGHSMGGRAMMYFALKYPELVDKLIVGDISPIATSPNLKSMPALFAAVQQVALPRNIPMSAARLTADMQLAKSVSDKGLRSFLLTNLIQKSDGSYAWRVNLPALRMNFMENIGRFPDVSNLQYAGPVLFVAGGVSDFIQKTDHPHILKLFPEAKFREVDGAGHWLHSEKPTEFLQICLEFLNSSVL